MSATATPASNNFERAAVRALADEGWEAQQDRDSGGHLVFRHRDTGVRIAVPKTPRSAGNAQHHLLQRARKAVREHGSHTARFLDHLVELYDVPQAGRKMVRFAMGEEVAAWKQRTPEARTVNPHTIADAARRHPRLDQVEPGARGRAGTWWLYGPRAVLQPPADDADVPEAEVERTPQNGARRGKVPKGMMAPSTERAVRWLELYLKDGPRFAQQVYGAGQQDGHSLYALQKAARHIGVAFDKEPRKQGRTWWRLPSTPPVAGARPQGAAAAPDTVKGAPVTTPRQEPAAPPPTAEEATVNPQPPVGAGETIHPGHPKAEEAPAPQVPVQPPLAGALDAGLVEQLRQALLAQELATMADLEARLGLAEDTLVAMQGQAGQVATAAAETQRHAKLLEDAAAGALALLRERAQLVLPPTEAP